MEANLEVPDIGQAVLIGDGIPGIITAITVRGRDNKVTYEVAWWDGRTRSEAWLDPSEVKLEPPTKKPLRIGFGGQ